MKAVLRTSLSGCDREATGVPGLRTRTRSRPGRGGEDDRKLNTRPFILGDVFSECRYIYTHLLHCCRSNYAGFYTGRGGETDLWRRRCRRDHGAHREVGHSGSRTQSSAQREEEIQSKPQVMYDLHEPHFINPKHTSAIMKNSSRNYNTYCVYLIKHISSPFLPDSETDSEERSYARRSSRFRTD